MFSLFETSVNGNVTFAYIMTFHCTSVLGIRHAFITVVNYQECLKNHGGHHLLQFTDKVHATLFLHVISMGLKFKLSSAFLKKLCQNCQ